MPSSTEEDAPREASLSRFFFLFFLIRDFFEDVEEGNDEEGSSTSTTLRAGSSDVDPSSDDECLQSTAEMCSLSSVRLTCSRWSTVDCDAAT